MEKREKERIATDDSSSDSDDESESKARTAPWQEGENKKKRKQKARKAKKMKSDSSSNSEDEKSPKKGRKSDSLRKVRMEALARERLVESRPKTEAEKYGDDEKVNY